MSKDILDRKGARKASDIPDEVMLLLNQGEIESVNLTEWLAVNHVTLLYNVLPSIGLEDKLEMIMSEISKHGTESGMKAIRVIGSLLNEVLNNDIDIKEKEILNKISIHASDTVRCWAAFMNKKTNHSLAEKLSYIRPFAADHHFGVREIAWMAVREDLSKDIDMSVTLLEEWAKSEDPYIRRFSVESIRPRGVWSKHIEELKLNPEKALPILNILKSDSSKYVQDSVGNWLNDASKSQPKWVSDLCEKWEKEHSTTETSRIIKKAKRTIMKKN